MTCKNLFIYAKDSRHNDYYLYIVALYVPCKISMIFAEISGLKSQDFTTLDIVLFHYSLRIDPLRIYTIIYTIPKNSLPWPLGPLNLQLSNLLLCRDIRMYLMYRQWAYAQNAICWIATAPCCVTLLNKNFCFCKCTFGWFKYVFFLV